MNDTLRQELEKRRAKLVKRNMRYSRMMRHWAEILISLLLVYVTLPFVAPTLMKLGATGPGNVLYTIYSPLCHQFAFRSMFLYGEEVFYPREVAGYDAIDTSFDEAAAKSPAFVKIFEERRRNEIRRSQGEEVAEAYEFSGKNELAQWGSALTLSARSFRGDEQMGYKVALCARDVAIYVAMVIGGILFLFVRKRLRPVPLPLYVLLGLGPIGLDGFSQLLSYPPFEFWPVRESIPIFRVLTGFLFGLMNVWLAFPYLDKSFKESADDIDTTVEAILAEEEQINTPETATVRPDQSH